MTVASHIHGKSLRDRQRLCYPSRLDDKVIKIVLILCECRDGFEQIATEGAAYAAIRKLYHLLFLLDEFVLLDFTGVQVYRPHIVHDHRNF